MLERRVRVTRWFLVSFAGTLYSRALWTSCMYDHSQGLAGLSSLGKRARVCKGELPRLSLTIYLSPSLFRALWSISFARVVYIKGERVSILPASQHSVAVCKPANNTRITAAVQQPVASGIV